MNYNYTTTTRALGDLRSARAGGIAMQMMYTHITGCMNAGEVTVPYANFGYGNSLAGGIVGKVVCLGQQLIHGLSPEAASTITSCYNIGKITGTYATGILGFTSTDCYISDCYNVGELVLDEDNPQKDYIPTFKDDIIVQGCNILEYGKKYVHDNGIKVVHGSNWIDSPTLGRKILKAIPEDKLHFNHNLAGIRIAFYLKKESQILRQKQHSLQTIHAHADKLLHTFTAGRVLQKLQAKIRSKM